MSARADADACVTVTGAAVRIVTLDRPARRNSLDGPMIDAVRSAMARLGEDPDVRAVVLTGAGAAFSAGGDFHLIRDMQDDPALRRSILDASRLLFETMVGLDVPVVAAVNGPAVGAGCTLALLCDVVFIAEDTYLSDPHVRLGLVPGDGAAVLWTALGGLPAARAYLLSGDRLPADEAARLGLAHRCVPSGQLLPEATAFARRMADLPPQAVRSTKKALNLHLRAESIGTIFDASLEAEFASFDTQEHRVCTSAAQAADPTPRAEEAG